MELGFHVLLHQQSIESLTGPKEVWSLNGYDSPVEQKQVAENYGKNPALIAALNQILKRKNNLTSEPVKVFTNYWQGLSRGTPWNMEYINQGLDRRRSPILEHQAGSERQVNSDRFGATLRRKRSDRVLWVLSRFWSG